MDPSAVLRPVGPREPRVYWIRRALVLAVPVLVIALLAYGCSGRAPGRPSPSASGRTAASSSPPPSAAAVGACSATDLVVSASTDAVRYSAGVAPQLKVTIRTKRAAGCVLTAGAGASTWAVYSGSDLVWTTAQCPVPVGRTAAARLDPAHPVARVAIWDRRRSVKGCSAAGRAAAQPGTYQLFVTVDGVKAGPAVFHLTS